MQSEMKKSVIISHLTITLLLAAAAFGVQLWLNKEYFHEKEAVPPSPVISYNVTAGAKNLTLEEFSVKYPGYKTEIAGYEYSYTVPEGNIIRVRDMFPTFTANVYVSSGSPKSAEDMDVFVFNKYDESGDGGAFYSLPEGRELSGQDLYGRYISDFYVKGETADTIRLDRINRDYCFFVSRSSGTFKYIPVLMDSLGHCISGDDYVNNGLVFTSRYEDGRIFLKAVNVMTEDCECIVQLTLKRLDGQVWRDTGAVLDKQGYEVPGYESAEKCIDIDLDSGIYKIGVTIGNEYTETEFYV